MAKTLISSTPFAGASFPFRHGLYPLPSRRLAATRVCVSFKEIPPLHSFISVENFTSALSKAESLLYTLVEATAANADDAVPQKNGGWFGFISDGMELVLKVLKDGFSAVHMPYSYGFAITLPSVIMKAATFPLTKKQVESTLAMQNLQPKIKAIQQRYAGNQGQLHRDQVSRNGGWRHSRIISCSRLQQSDSKSDLKSQLYVALEGVNRGIFGVASDKKSEIEGVAKLLESCNPTPHPALNLHKVGGCWKLLYTSLTILGSKRTKLGLRDFISLGDFLQIIDASKRKAVNIIKFNIRGFNLIDASLTIEASFNVASISRVDITYDSSTITPQKLMNMFSKNYNLLLAVFNPEGWLEITYVDDDIRIGRDDKSNIFILERLQDQISP